MLTASCGWNKEAAVQENGAAYGSASEGTVGASVEWDTMLGVGEALVNGLVGEEKEIGD
jgi:hypothetical protein